MKIAGEGRRERKKRELRQRLYEQAGRLFWKQGFDATTVEQIAAAADVSQATFFNYYPSKDALIDQMATQVVAIVGALVEEQRKTEASTAERIADMAGRATRMIEQTQLLTRDLLRALMRRGGDSGRLLEEVRDAMAELMRDGQQRGDVRADRSAEFLAEMLIGVFYGTITHWLETDTYPLRARMGEAAEFLCEAIAPGDRSEPEEAE